MKVVILCGGKGMRMRGHTQNVPKALVEVQGKPLLWHIMKTYAAYGFNEFILPLGYKGEDIKEYFMHYHWKSQDFTIDLETNEVVTHQSTEDWKIQLIDTGDDTMTGARIKSIQPYIPVGESFMVTYGDGLSDINVGELVKHHKKTRKIGTVTGVKKENPFGVLEVKDGIVTSFAEKPLMPSFINAGYFVFDYDFFTFLDKSPDCVLEEEPLRTLSAASQLAIYPHPGSWMAVDTPKDLEDANKKWGIKDGYLSLHKHN